jgi:hypothetical protein
VVQVLPLMPFGTFIITPGGLYCSGHGSGPVKRLSVRDLSMKPACCLHLVGQLGPLTVNWRPGGLTNLIGQGTPRYNVYSIKIWVFRVKLKIGGLLGIEIPQFN